MYTKSIYERPGLNISARYAFYLKSMFNLAFYSPLIPFGLFITLFGFIFSYWVDKNTILRHRSVRH